MVITINTEEETRLILSDESVEEGFVDVYLLKESEEETTVIATVSVKELHKAIQSFL